MALTITNLRVDYRKTEKWFNDKEPCPYIIFNCCFKIDRSNDSFTWEQARADSEDYKKVLTIDNPERYKEWLMSESWNFSTSYAGNSKAWVYNECIWQYIEKFDTFWHREWIADCTVTRAIIAELQYYKTHGKLPSVYRTLESSIVLHHLRTLHSYWD
jgi:hypothetical protein